MIPLSVAACARTIRFNRSFRTKKSQSIPPPNALCPATDFFVSATASPAQQHVFFKLSVCRRPWSPSYQPFRPPSPDPEKSQYICAASIITLPPRAYILDRPFKRILLTQIGAWWKMADTFQIHGLFLFLLRHPPPTRLKIAQTMVPISPSDRLLRTLKNHIITLPPRRAYILDLSKWFCSRV